MDIEELLSEDGPGIVAEACDGVARVERYRRDGAEATRRRIEALLAHVGETVRARDLRDVRAYAERVARERRGEGFALADVEAAFEALERAIWRHALLRLPRYDQEWALALACTALRHGEDALRRVFAPGAAPAPRPPVADLTTLFAGAPGSAAAAA